MSQPGEAEPSPGPAPDAFGKGVQETRSDPDAQARCPSCGAPVPTGGAEGVTATCGRCGREFRAAAAGEAGDAGGTGAVSTDELRPEDEERLYTGDPLDTGSGVDVPAQQNVGPASRGGGEWPDPSTPPQAPAPGAVDEAVPEATDDDGTA